jgi:hypothetical protein
MYGPPARERRQAAQHAVPPRARRGITRLHRRARLEDRKGWLFRTARGHNGSASLIAVFPSTTSVQLFLLLLGAQLDIHSMAALRLGCVERSSPEAAKRCAAGAGLDGDEACRATIVRAVIGVPVSPWRDRRVPAFASAVDAPRGSCFSSRSTRGRLTMGCEGRTLQSLSRTRSARRPRAGRYAQSSEPRPRGTSLAGGEPWAISWAARWRRMPRSRRGSTGTRRCPPTCGA